MRTETGKSDGRMIAQNPDVEREALMVTITNPICIQPHTLLPAFLFQDISILFPL